MGAEQDTHGLKAPRDHGPLARQVDPFFARIARQQRSQRKRKGYGRNRKSGIAGIKIRRMNHHLRILQQRSQAVAIGASKDLERAVRSRRRQHFERTGHEIIQGQKENLHAGQHHADIGHQLPIFITVNQQDGEDINGQQKTPEQQRAFLTGPQRGDLIKRSEIAIAMRDHIGDPVAIAEKQVNEAGSG